MRRIKKILIAVLLFVVTLNVNYLGVTDKKIVVESSEYNEGNTSNLVLNKILSDNELKTEIPHMFNYASNGNYYDFNSRKELNDSNYITNGLYSSSDEDGTTYYYRGDIDNNNLVFGAYDEDYYVYGSQNAYFQTKESCIEALHNENKCIQRKLENAGDKMYWKIIRVNGDGSLRLIYNGPGFNIRNLGPVSFIEEEISGVVGTVPYNLEINDPKYSGYTYDNGTDSFIKKEVDTWYNNTLGSNPDYDKYVILGRYCSDSSGYNYDGDGSFASFDRLGQAWNNFTKDNAPTFICPDTNESYGGSYRLKAGLITSDELVYAGETLRVVTGNSYLKPGEDGTYYWSMTPASFNDGYAFVWNENDAFFTGSTSYNLAIRPVINVSTENMTLIGDGTIDNPYILEEVEPSNSYKGKVTIEVGSSVDDVKAFEEELDLSGVTWTVKDSTIAKIENGKIIGLKSGTTVITGVGSDGTSYEIEVTVISNPVTNSALYIGIGLILILILGTGAYITYRIKNVANKN